MLYTVYVTFGIQYIVLSALYQTKRTIHGQEKTLCDFTNAYNRSPRVMTLTE